MGTVSPPSQEGAVGRGKKYSGPWWRGWGGVRVDLKGIKMAGSTGLLGPVLIESGRE